MRQKKERKRVLQVDEVGDVSCVLTVGLVEVCDQDESVAHWSSEALNHNNFQCRSDDYLAFGTLEHVQAHVTDRMYFHAFQRPMSLL